MNRLSWLLLLAIAPVQAVEPKLVRIAPGKFQMGTPGDPPKSLAEWTQRDYDESPQHGVEITRELWIGSTEVTNADYAQFDPEHRARIKNLDGATQKDDEPVNFVSWNQAVAYCEWLSKKEGKPYRLPTEAEWEYACRAGTTTPFHTGDSLTAEQANVGLNKDGKPIGPLPVASFKANPWGLFDMHGNVAEWCHDWHGPYDAANQTDPVGRVDGYARVVRGWSTHRPERAANPHKMWRSANRSGLLPEDANRYTGFRVVQAELPKTAPLPLVASPYQKDVKQTPAPIAGPDAKVPYYVNYTAAGAHPSIAKDAFGPVFANHNHYGAVTICPNGDVLMAWYTCVNEPGRELAQAVSRLRVGSERWEPASPFFDVPDVNDHAPVLLTSGKRIFHFSTQSIKGWDHATDVVRYSDDNGVSWSKPTVVVSRDSAQALSQPCSAFVAKTGEIVLACDGDLHRDERVVTSADNGKTWKVRWGDMRATAGKYAIHPAIAQRSDGQIINFLRGPDPMPVQFSKDLGDTWTQKDSPFPGIRSGQKATALKLQSGAMLLVSMDNAGKLVAKGKTFAALSLDDGETWAHVRQLDGVQGYMSSAQAPNGVIYVTGTKQSAVAINEAWLREGKPIK